MYRDPEQLKTQAHISTPLLPKSVAVAVDNLSSDKDSPQRVPSSVPTCSKMDDDNDSSINVSNVENERSETDRKGERVNVLNNTKQEKEMGENHAAASSRKDDENERGRCSSEARTKVQEDVYEVKFVRCNCVNVQSHSSGMFTY